MPNIKESVMVSYAYLSGLTENGAVLKEADWLSFFVSLLPAPGVQQIGQIANKIITDKELSVRFDDVRKEISNTNGRINQLESAIDRIGEIAKTVSSVSDLEKLVEGFLKQIVDSVNKDQSEFLMDTTNWSAQSLIDSMVEADWVSISAIEYSQNTLKDLQVRAKKTHLRADNNSSNVVRDTTFLGEKGSIKMNGITQKGHISIENNSIGFHGNSKLIFGKSPDILKGACPICGATIQVNKNKIQGYTTIKCPSCNSILPFQVK